MPVDYTTEARLAYLGWLENEERAEEEHIRTLRDYLAGRQPVYLTDRQKEFIGLKAKNADYLYAHNLCSLIVDTATERLTVLGFESKNNGESLAALAAAWWERNRMDSVEDKVYEAALGDGYSYIIVDNDGEGPRWTFNRRYDGTQGVKLHRDPSTDVPIFASKRWQTYDMFDAKASARTRVTLYYRDRVEKYISAEPNDRPGPADNKIQDDNLRRKWHTIMDDGDDEWPIALGIDDVPVFEFENPGGSEIEQVLSMQDTLNKSDLDLLGAADNTGFQRTVLSGVMPEYEDDGVTVRPIELVPGGILSLTDPAASATTLPPGDLKPLIDTCDYYIRAIAGQSRTPHYLLRGLGADQPSGESLRMQEIGMVDKCQRKQKIFGNVWEDIIYYSAKLMGMNAGNARISTVWKEVGTRDELTVWQVAQAKKAANIPDETIWAEAGYEQDEIDRMKEQRLAEQSLGSQLLKNFETAFGNA